MKTPSIRVKIIGAGSIGNHLAQAARRMGWNVTVVDRDEEALRRMKEEIYPARYGAWDEAIQLSLSQNEPKGGFDIICIGTPPDTHLALASKILKEEPPRILQIEKPLCTPLLTGLQDFLKLCSEKKKTTVLVGYDHVVSEAIEEVLHIIDGGEIGAVETIDTEFRVHWKGIFAAHPWLKGPEDTYLGYWKRGGGAGNEHSHTLHLWDLLAKHARFGKLTTMHTALRLKKQGKAEYDSLAAFMFVTDTGKVGRVIQDVITFPTRQWARVQGEKGFVEWVCNGHPEGDLVRYALQNGEVKEKIFKKKRPDDFFREMSHFKSILEGKTKAKDSPMSLESGVRVMRLLAEAYRHSNKTISLKD